MDPIYIQLENEINETTLIIEALRTQIESYLKMGNIFNGPHGIKGIDYTKDRVDTSVGMAFSDAVRKIDEKEKYCSRKLRNWKHLGKSKINLTNYIKVTRIHLRRRFFILGS